MANQHTPKPKFLPPFNNIFEGVDIAKCLTQTIEKDQVLKQARARLISAAPELLEALLAAEACLSNLREVQRWDHPNNIDPYGEDHIDECVHVIGVARAAIAKATQLP